MKCVWTQKVSLLIDGELERADAREVEIHLDTCADCREAREDFLSLRRQIADYRIELDAFAAQRALKRILAAGASGAKMENDGGVARSRRRVERFAGLFGMPRLSPAGLAALFLLLACVAIGIVSLTNARRTSPEIAKTVPAHAPSSDVRHKDDNAQPAPAEVSDDPTAGANNGEETIAGNDLKRADQALAKVPSRRAPEIERTRERASRVENAGNKVKKSSTGLNALQVDTPVAQAASNNAETIEDGVSGVGSIEAGDAGDDLAAARGEGNVTGDSKTARHVEQAQLLLRSFRNARVADAGRRASSDLAYDKRQSKKLLYQNIVLRREAASRGNLPVESLLDSLEPILIDIANLPDKPAPEDVRMINERMRRKNLVAMLQISSVESASARSY
jgi:hypothetical protein